MNKKKKYEEELEYIEIKDAYEHNLKHVDVQIPINKLTVITGLSGSGKSTLAFDTLYAEGQRRYVESLSSYARQFIGIMNKPKVESIRGLSPAISIEQKTVSRNPRSTVGTITEIYDYLRLLFARIGKPHCHKCGVEIKPQDAQMISKRLLAEFEGLRIGLLAPVVRGKKGNYKTYIETLIKDGYIRGRIDGELVRFEDFLRENKGALERYKKHDIDIVVDRLVVSKDEKSRLTQALEQALQKAHGLANVIIFDEDGSVLEEHMFSKHLACPDCNISFDELQPRMFSFNSPYGACETCHGLGSVHKFDADLVIPDKSRTVWEGGILPWKKQVYGWKGRLLEAVAEEIGLDLEEAIKNWSNEHLEVILYGHPKMFKVNSPNSDNVYSSKFEGVMNELERHYKQTDSEARKREIEQYIRNQECPACAGARLSPISLAVTLDSLSIIDVTDLPIVDAVTYFESLKLNEQQQIIVQELLREIKTRLSFLSNVGLDYLSLSRSSGTLSGGEAQRIRLATQIGSELRGVLYILDEPSIGLHQRDNDKLIATLQHLRNLKNTVVVVEHDESTIRTADYVLDIGPGAGVHGGAIVAAGSPDEVAKNKKSLTGEYISGRKKIKVPKRRRKPQGFIRLKGATSNNLKQVDADFPVGVFGCVTGVSGSGKSTLVIETLQKVIARKFHDSKDKPGEFKDIENLGFIDKMVVIDQKPIGRTPRSNAATYTGVFTDIRDLFTQTKEAKARGYKPGRFSFNVAEGRCSNCSGDGVLKIEMHFLSDVYVECEQCKGQRYNDETLEVEYNEKNIAQVLDMTVDEALVFFGPIPKIKNKLQTLSDVGLGYIKLGQSATTLSGGEAQRIKLSTELSKRGTGKTLYILDEPTTGLHFEDVKKLLEVLNRLVEKGNTVLVIEHNMDVIKTSDYILDMGPEGGDGGGELIAKGTPEEVSRNKKSHTGKYLRDVL